MRSGQVIRFRRPRRGYRAYATPWIVVALAALVLAIPVAMKNGTLARTVEHPAPTRLDQSRYSAMLPGAAPVEGLPHVIDGDTIDIGSTRIRLEGIDAPEGGQTCARAGGGTWRCGQAASGELQKLIERQSVRCENHGTDSYGRMLGICFAGTTDINAEMVRRGFAWAFVKYSRTYVAEEADARARGAGIWQAPTTTAWDYRAGRWTVADDAIPDKCPIKGNIASGEHIYHMPWSPWYSKVRIDERKGERWFCTEGEAIAAGWRPARVN